MSLRAFIMWHFDWWMEALMPRRKHAAPLPIKDWLTPGNDPGPFNASVATELLYQRALLERIDARTTRFERSMHQILRDMKERDMALQNELDKLKAELVRNTDAKNAIKALVTSLLDRIEASADDEDEVRNIVSEFKANNDELAGLAVQNTPADTNTGSTTPNTPPPGTSAPTE